MTIKIELRPDEERELRELAQASGRDVSEYVHHVLTEHLRSGRSPEVTSKTFDQILAPIRKGWQQSGMTEHEITALFEETRDEVRQERRARKETP